MRISPQIMETTPTDPISYTKKIPQRVNGKPFAVFFGFEAGEMREAKRPRVGVFLLLIHR
jgi:hypothetical protein